jgi:hypothetical protein
MKISPTDIRFARPCDLAALTGIDASSFTAWTGRRKLTEQSIQAIAKALEMTPGEFLTAWELRREDWKKQQEAIANLQVLIANRACT